MDENIEYAKSLYEWNEERNHLIQKLDGNIVAEAVKTKDVWVANNTSRTTKKKIGTFETVELARQAVERAFGLRE